MKLYKIIALSLFSVVLYSCSKNTGLSGYIKDLNILYNDTLYIGKSIKFYSTAAPTSKFLWTFGTGATSTLDSPVYTFLVPRPFNVTLQVNDTGTPVSKSVYISIGQDILGKITESRTWNVHYTAHNPSGTPPDTDTVYSHDGTYFAINNDTSISTSISILSYIYPGTLLPAGRSVTFGTGNIGSTTDFWSTAYYDYSIDSLHYIVYNPIPGGYTKYEFSSVH